jgi:hypothetical protein
MAEYSFTTLSGDEFERLVADLLSAEYHVNIERFTRGKDGGIDGRFYSDGAEVILQAKHWRESGFKALNSHMKKELLKVKRLAPKRYLLATSVGLTPGNKTTLMETLSPYITMESDILGADDLNALLIKHPDVEKGHYKLWLSSASVLDRILNNAVVGRSAFVMREAVCAASRYAHTKCHTDAVAKLNSAQTVIITGAPGAGKTTLAKQLCVDLASSGYQFCFIEGSVTDAESIFREGVKQVFLFDDFLGRSFLSAITDERDSHVLQFARRVRADKSKRFVLTSRTTILNQAFSSSDRFRIDNANKYVLEVRLMFRPFAGVIVLRSWPQP